MLDFALKPESPVQPVPAAAGDPAPALPLDLAPVCQSVSREFSGRVPLDRIEQVLRGLLQGEFSQARVMTYLPIFLHRGACERLRSEERAPPHAHRP